MLYGEAVAAALRRPYNNLLVDPALNHEPDHTSSIDPDHISKLDPHHVSNLDPDHTPNLDLDHNLVPEPDLSWALLPAKELVQRLEKLDRADIVKCIGNLPRSHRPGSVVLHLLEERRQAPDIGIIQCSLPRQVQYGFYK
ncbi:hypothetical protein P692DRAFT_201808945 [Suillus brevipes Sb2]|nr:hypothetical protein P692DRAFT_201808945 [Suillus brevipes Sb2]